MSEEKSRLEVAPVQDVEDETCRTFMMHEEDHTLGNALRFCIQKNPATEFCGYSVPHPSEHVINLRIQTHQKSANAVLEKGLEDLNAMCDIIHKKLLKSVAEFKSGKTSESGDEKMDT